jgi:cytochrome b involved in lipid metabolism
MRISFIPTMGNVNGFQYLTNFISKIDRRIALIATSIFLAIGCLIYYMRRTHFKTSGEPDKNPLRASPQPINQEEERILELQKKHPGMKILTDKDFDEADQTDQTWVVIGEKVYDLTKFIDLHPGGEEVLIKAKGKNASTMFEHVGHSDEAIKMMKDYYIGIYGGKGREQYKNKEISFFA